MKKILFCVMLSFVLSLSYANDFVIAYFTGVWYRSPNPVQTTEAEYSWGRGKTVVNFTLDIDLLSESESINIPMLGGPFEITEFKTVKEKELYELTFYFNRGGFYESYYVHVNFDEGYIWFEGFESNTEELIPEKNGENPLLWYKIDGLDHEEDISDLLAKIKHEQLSGDDENIVQGERVDILKVFEPLTDNEILVAESSKRGREQSVSVLAHDKNNKDVSRLIYAIYSYDNLPLVTVTPNGMYAIETSPNGRGNAYINGKEGITLSIPLKKNADGDYKTTLSADGKYLIVQYGGEEKRVLTHAIGYVTDNKLRVRAEPRTGETLGHVKKDDRVIILGRSKTKDTIDNLTAYWYKVKFGTSEGWMYGGYVDVEERDIEQMVVVDGE